MVIVKIYGGMANQLFQYAAGYALAIKHGVPLKLDISYFHELNTDTKRVFELNKFLIDYQLASQEEIQQLFKFRKIDYALNKIMPFAKKKFYGEKKIGFDDDFFKLGSHIYLRGYFQSEKYFLDCKLSIFQQFIFRNTTNDHLQLFLEKLNQQKTVALHIRLGDYLQPSTNSIMASFDLSYYKSSIEYIQKHVNDAIFLVFSDQIPLAKQLLTIEANLLFVDASISKSADEDFVLMQSCQHQIIANSTFSWWAAYLNQKSGKIMVAPRKWYKDHFGDATDLYPKNCIVL
jgi:hypothetical protein